MNDGLDELHSDRDEAPVESRIGKVVYEIAFTFVEWSIFCFLIVFCGAFWIWLGSLVSDLLR